MSTDPNPPSSVQERAPTLVASLAWLEPLGSPVIDRVARYVLDGTEPAVLTEIKAAGRSVAPTPQVRAVLPGLRAAGEIDDAGWLRLSDAWRAAGYLTSSRTSAVEQALDSLIELHRFAGLRAHTAGGLMAVLDADGHERSAARHAVLTQVVEGWSGWEGIEGYRSLLAEEPELVTTWLGSTKADERWSMLVDLVNCPEVAVAHLPRVIHLAARDSHSRVRERALTVLDALSEPARLVALQQAHDDAAPAAAELIAQRPGLSTRLDGGDAVPGAFELLAPVNVDPTFVEHVMKDLDEARSWVAARFEAGTADHWTELEQRRLEPLTRDIVEDYVRQVGSTGTVDSRGVAEAARSTLLTKSFAFARDLPLRQGIRWAVLTEARQSLVWRISRLREIDADLRAVAAAIDEALPAPSGEDVRAVSPGVAAVLEDWQYLTHVQPNLLWPFFAEHPEMLEVELGVRPHPSEWAYEITKLDLALTIVAAFPRIPHAMRPRVEELALGQVASCRRQAQDLLAHQGGLDVAIRGLGAKAPAVRTTAARWLVGLVDRAEPGDNTSRETARATAVEALAAALAVEKGEVVQAAMLGALRALGADLSTFLAPAKLEAAAAVGLTKKAPAGMEWVPLDGLPALRWADGASVDPIVPRWWCTLAVQLKDPLGEGLLPLYVALLDRPSQRALGSYLLAAWVMHDLTRGTAIKEKGLLALTTGAPGIEVAEAITRYARRHPERRVQVEVLVTAASANEDPVALQLVTSIARSFRQRSVRERAAELVEQIAARRGWSTDELADRVIPTAGFPTTEEVAAEALDADKADADAEERTAVRALELGVAILDFGPRHFTMRIGPDLTTALFTAEGALLKALPKPGVKDDAELAKAARSAVTSAKKELAQVVDLQTARLLEAMALGRTWSAAAWREVFGDHPVMRHLVSRLIWAAGPVGPDGEPVDGAPVTLFLPTLDGELLDIDDADVALAPDARLWLAHASRLDAATVARWRERLADYGVTPLVDQLNQLERASPSFVEGATELNDREGWTQTVGALRSRAVKQGFQLGSGQDGGVIESVVKDIGPWRADIALSGIPPEHAAGGSVAVTRLRLERAGRAVPLEQVPPVLLAVVHGAYLAIADGGTFDPEWRARTSK